jgi:integrase
MLEENNTRKGFFERAEFEQLLARLPEGLRPVVTLAYAAGWRIKSEILSLTWDQEDLETRTVRLYRGMTKNKEGRLVYPFPELLSLLAALWREHMANYPVPLGLLSQRAAAQGFLRLLGTGLP